MNQFSTCPHFAFCSGCEIEQNFSEPPIKKEILSFFEKQRAPISFHYDGFLQTRWKAKLAIRGTFKNPLIGLFKKGTHETISIPHCLVHRAQINKCALVLSEKIQKHQIDPYKEDSQTGLLRYAQFFVERETNLIQLALVINDSEITPNLDSFLKDLQQSFPLHSIWINFHEAPNNKIFGDSWTLYSGNPWIWQKLNDVQVAFHPASFSQVHLPLFEKMLIAIRSWTPPNCCVLELFAGTGAIALSIKDRCKAIELIENNPFSALSFQESLKKLSPEEQIRYSYVQSDASGPLNNYDLIIVDPPRKGIGKTLVDELNKNKSKQLIYISCNFASFRKDAEGLIEGGWKLKEGKGFFLFPGTNQIETLALFERK